MRALPHRPTMLLTGLALVAAVALGACSSDAEPTPSKAELRSTNRTFLMKKANFDDRQATCVSKRVTVDLSQVLSKAVGDADATKKDGYDQFARAVRVCITEDRSLTTSTTR